VIVLDTSLVDTDVLQKSSLLGITEPLRFHGGVWKDEEGGQSNQSSRKADEHEHGLPCVEALVCDVLEHKGYKASDDLSKPETGIPHRESRGLLSLGVVLTADQHQAWGDSSLENSEEDTCDEERVVVESSGSCCTRDSPEENVDT
jgi:hypothetical protein